MRGGGQPLSHALRVMPRLRFFLSFRVPYEGATIKSTDVPCTRHPITEYPIAETTLILPFEPAKGREERELVDSPLLVLGRHTIRGITAVSGKHNVCSHSCPTSFRAYRQYVVHLQPKQTVSPRGYRRIDIHAYVECMCRNIAVSFRRKPHRLVCRAGQSAC